MPERIVCSDAPAAIGPYSQAVRAGNFIFVSGQIPLDPATGQVTGRDAAEQAARVMENITAILRQAGAAWGDVVKTTIYLLDMADFGAVNEVYGRYLADPPPARACVGVSALPRGVRVEIEVAAYLDRRGI